MTSFVLIMFGFPTGDLNPVYNAPMLGAHKAFEDMGYSEVFPDYESPLPLDGWLFTNLHLLLWSFAWIDQDSKRTVMIWNDTVKLARQALAEPNTAAATLYEDALYSDRFNFPGSSTHRSLYDRFRYPLSNEHGGVGIGIVKKAAETQTMRELAVAALALEMHRLKNGTYPETLDALVSTILDEVPRDFMDGTPLKYRRINGDEFLLYSSGEDGVDDGGDPSWRDGAEVGSSIWDGRDAVWPKVAE